jgi:hypothetical protein
MVHIERVPGTVISMILPTLEPGKKKPILLKVTNIGLKKTRKLKREAKN